MAHVRAQTSEAAMRRQRTGSGGFVDVQHDSRFAGETSYSFRKLWKHSQSIILAYSTKPLRLCVGLGIGISFLSVIVGFFYLAWVLIYGSKVSGWASLIISLYFSTGAIIFTLGVVGLYVGRIFTEVKGRPLFVGHTELASHDDERADYSEEAIGRMLETARPDRARPIADIGAGTGKLTRLLLGRGFKVLAVEPNAAMREIGIANTNGKPVVWSVGTGEATGLPGAAFDLVTFGSSFNVTDRARTLREVQRILRPRGWFACMWNHRDLDDPLQAKVEAIIRSHIPEYDYGTRREDQTGVIRASGLFEEPIAIEGRTTRSQRVADYVEAWRSHATLQRQAGERLAAVIRAIEALLDGAGTIVVPYTTRLWCARLR